MSYLMKPRASALALLILCSIEPAEEVAAQEPSPLVGRTDVARVVNEQSHADESMPPSGLGVARSLMTTLASNRFSC